MSRPLPRGLVVDLSSPPIKEKETGRRGCRGLRREGREEQERAQERGGKGRGAWNVRLGTDLKAMRGWLAEREGGQSQRKLITTAERLRPKAEKAQPLWGRRQPAWGRVLLILAWPPNQEPILRFYYRPTREGCKSDVPSALSRRFVFQCALDK
jgi:hypothetical protein